MALIAISIFLYLRGERAPEKQIVKHEGITHYYRNPQPDRLIPLLESVLKQKRLISHPGYFGPFVHFFATVIQGNVSKLEELKSIQNNFSGESREAINKIIIEAENYKPVELGSPEDLEYLWAEFEATGRKDIIERIMKVVDWPGTSGEGRLGGAAASFLAKKAPQHVEVYDLLREKSESLEGNEKRVIDEILNVIKVSAVDSGHKYMRRGLNYANLGKHNKALKEYRRALDYFPDYAAVYVNMANLYEKMGKSHEAFNAMQKAVEIDPNDPMACYGLGRHYAFLGKYDDAIKYTLKALEYLPNKPMYLHALARNYQQKGDKENAIIYFKKYLEYAPNGEHVFLVKQYLASVGKPVEEVTTDVVVMLQNKQYDTLEKHFASLLKEKVRDKEGDSLLVNAYRKLCDHPDAEHRIETWVNYFKDWLKHNESSHFANACIGAFYIRYAWHARGTGWANTVTKEGHRLYRERLLLAKEYLEKAYALDQSDPIVPSELITVARGLGLPREEMEKQFERAIQADRSEYSAYGCKLNYLMPKWYGSKDSMFNFAREAARNAPRGSLIPLVLADAHWEMFYRSKDQAFYFKDPETWREVKNVYTTVSESFPDSKAIHNWFALSAYLAGDNEIAKRELTRVGNDWLEDAWGDKKYFDDVRKKLLGS
jgi:tetratricopeptide (TPR) repeat protein